MDIVEQPFGRTGEGQPVTQFTLTNAGGVTAQITNYGGIITSLMTPDRDGRLGDIVLGFDRPDAYRAGHPYFGALVGRCANRIGGARFHLDGVEYRLARNDGPNHLHGGVRGFDKVVWEAEPVTGNDSRGVGLTYLSPDGEENYPGNLSVQVIYTLTDADELRIDYRAATDKPTIVNLTNHSYFNLAGEGDVLNHVVMLNARHFTPIDATLIPTGEVRSVAGTPLDFRRPTVIGARIDADDEQLRLAGGYDHNFVLDRSDDGLALAARVTEPTTGRVLEVLTTQPGVQFYTGNSLPEMAGKAGRVYRRRCGFCLETQHFPDAPNRPNFPSIVLRPGEEYRQTTVFRFAVED